MQLWTYEYNEHSSHFPVWLVPAMLLSFYKNLNLLDYLAIQFHIYIHLSWRAYFSTDCGYYRVPFEKIICSQHVLLSRLHYITNFIVEQLVT